MSLTQQELDAILSDNAKEITEDIDWKGDNRSTSKKFRREIKSNSGYPIFVDRWYGPDSEKLSYAIIYRGVGRIYGLDLGAEHRNPDGKFVGEKHKHRWQQGAGVKWAYDSQDITALWNQPVMESARKGMGAILRRGKYNSLGYNIPTLGERDTMDSNKICFSIGKSLPGLFQCSPAPHGRVRVRTPMLYPDGGVIDVFIMEHDGGYLVTDFGEALGWLGMQSASARLSPNQEALIEDVCQTLSIESRYGQLMLRLGADDTIGEAVIRLAQAVARISNLWFTFRRRSEKTTSDEVDEWLREKDIPFERAVSRLGQSGQDWTIDYQTQVNDRISLVFLLSVGSRRTARRVAEHVLAGCVDLRYLTTNEPNLTFVSLFDDRKDVWSKRDFQLLREHSKIAQWSQLGALESLLTKL